MVSTLFAPSSALADKVVVNAVGQNAEEEATGGFFRFPRGLAVNATGNGGVPAGTVYAVDSFNNRVQVFSSSGAFLRAFGADVGGAGVNICTIAPSCMKGTAGAAAGQFGFAGGKGITADQSNGNLYITDQRNRRVDIFSATGTFEGAFGREVKVTGAAEELQFCTTATGCQAGATANTSAAGAFGTTLGYPAVAPAGSPDEGNLYVADNANRRVDEFEPTIVAGEVTGVAFVRGYGWGASTGAEEFEVCTSTCHEPSAAGSSLGQFAIEAPSELGIDSGGNVYALDPGNNRVQKFSATPAPLNSSFASAQLATTPAPTDIAVDPSVGGHVYVNKSNGTEINTLEFNSNGLLVATNGVGTGLTFTTGLAYDPTSENIWLDSPENPAFALFALNTEVPPTATLSEPVDVTGPNSALFEGAVNPEGFDATYRFEYSTDGVSWTRLPTFEFEFVDLGAGTSPIPVSQEATALLANTEYLVRLVATKPFGAGTATTAPAIFQTPAGAPVIDSVSAENITSNSAELKAQVNPEGAIATCRFEYGTEEGVYGHEAGCAPAELKAQNEIQKITIEATAGQFRLRFGGEQTGDLTFNEPTLPNVQGALSALSSIGPGNVSVSGGPVAGAGTNSYLVTFEGALAGKDVEQIAVENGTQPLQKSEGGNVQPGSATVSTILNGGLSSPIPVSATIGGLEPDTTYHYRLVAGNSVGPTTIGADHILRTFANAPSGSGLPDGRAYEMVSPPKKLGEVYPPEPNLILGGRETSSCQAFECLPGVSDTITPMQSSPDGEAVVYEGQPFFGGLAAAPNEYLSHRTSSGWSTESVSPLLYEPLARQGYKAFSSDLSEGVISQIGPALSPGTPTFGGEAYANLYLTNDVGSLQPLVTNKPPNRDPGFRDSEHENRFLVIYAGANPGTASTQAFSHVVFEANDALTGLTGTAPAAEDGGNGGGGVLATNLNLYEWVGGQLRLVNVQPSNAATAPGAVLGSGRLLAGPFPEFEAPDVDHAISADGSRIFWSEEASGQVYVRVDGRETREIEDHEGKFLTASPDGSKVLLSDGCLYDLEAEPPAEPCQDLTLDESDVHQGGFQGILGASEDLSHVYFVDTAELTGENAEHKSPVATEDNLYVYEPDPANPGQFKTVFVGKLLGNDNNVDGSERYGAWHPSRLNRTAQVSPDGSFLAFMSTAPLTGYDNEVRSVGCKGNANAASAPSCFEVFEYDASTASLTCPSCNPTGQRPLGQSSLSLIRSGAGPLGPQPGNLTAEGQGRLFFESQDELSPHDTNGAIQDVYQWEPSGVGSCKQAKGCVDLISSGHAAGDSFFLDATPSGNDAFIVTREQLLPQDKDDRLDLYDARAPHTPGEVLGFPEGETAPCVGEACKGPIASPPVQQSAGSGEFSGPPNPKHVCPKGKVRKHGKCVRKHHKHHKRHHRRADSNRRASR